MNIDRGVGNNPTKERRSSVYIQSHMLTQKPFSTYSKYCKFALSPVLFIVHALCPGYYARQYGAKNEYP